MIQTEFEFNQRTQKKSNDINYSHIRNFRTRLFRKIEHTKTPGIIRGLLILLDHTHSYDKEYDWSTASFAVTLLKAMLEDYPNYDPKNKYSWAPYSEWRQWRKDLREGRAALVFKGDPNRYSLTGEILDPQTPRWSARTPPTRQSISQASKNAAKNKASNHSSNDGQASFGWAFWSALGFLICALIFALGAKHQGQAQ